jgi:mRNA interferase RelE/StbE
MSYNIEIKPSAQKALAKIPQPQRGRIVKRIDRLAAEPRPKDSKKLSTEDSLYRVRVGDYRIIYQVEDDVLLVLVVRIGSRGDVYRGLQ